LVAVAFDQGDPETEEMRKVVRGAHREICEGGFISTPFNVVVGRRGEMG